MKYCDKQSTKPGTVDARQVADVVALTNVQGSQYRIKFTDTTHNDVSVGSVYWPFGARPVAPGDWFVGGAFGGYMTDKAFHDRYEPAPDTANRYVSHKEVTAYEFVTYAPLITGGYQVTLRDHDPIDCEDAVFARYRPSAGDFLVIYADGYKSFSPRAAFLDGYKPKVEVRETTMSIPERLSEMLAEIDGMKGDLRLKSVAKTQIELGFLALEKACK